MVSILFYNALLLPQIWNVSNFTFQQIDVFVKKKHNSCLIHYSLLTCFTTEKLFLHDYAFMHF